jgi:sugar phosphate permease
MPKAWSCNAISEIDRRTRVCTVPLPRGSPGMEGTVPDDARTTTLITVRTERPTNVRWLIVGLLFTVTAVNYADRATIAIAGPVISKDLGLNAQQMGFIFSAFGWAYVIAQLPGGWLLDHYGS